jgi:hypothetical protein
MSHKVTQTPGMNNVTLLESTAKARGVRIDIKPQKVELYSETVSADAALYLKDWSYPVAINFATGNVQYDNYEGKWGAEDELDAFVQEYRLQLAEAAMTELYGPQGWRVERRAAENGVMQVVAVQ